MLDIGKQRRKFAEKMAERLLDGEVDLEYIAASALSFAKSLNSTRLAILCQVERELHRQARESGVELNGVSVEFRNRYKEACKKADEQVQARHQPHRTLLQQAKKHGSFGPAQLNMIH